MGDMPFDCGQHSGVHLVLGHVGERMKREIDAKTNEHYFAMLEKAADSYARRSPWRLGAEAGLPHLQWHTVACVVFFLSRFRIIARWP